MRRAGVQPIHILILFALAVVCGCSGDKTKTDKSPKEKTRTDGSKTEAPTTDAPKTDAPKTESRDGDPEAATKSPADRPDSRESKMEEPLAGGVTTGSGKNKGPHAGTLTAGSFDDNRDPMPYRSFFRQIGQDGVLRGFPSEFLGHRLILTIKDSAGQPVGNARVTIAGEGGQSVGLVSRTDGRVIFIPAWDKVPADGDFVVTVQPAGGAVPVRQTVSRSAIEHSIVLPSVQASAPKELDLTLVIDTTGSMGDELEYIKSEMRSIARTLNERFPQVNQRYALIFYRDEGDEYVTRKFDFTTSIDDVRRNLHAQSAAGGGDPPEAMQAGLEDAVNLQWRTGNTARVLFLLADAPPHTQHMTRALKAIDALRKKGVAMYPVACSGYDNPTEFVMRTAALLSGGQFLFLTDDSGLGNAHAEPHLTNYHVERLDRLMIRMIASELAGKRIEPEPGSILRTVGRAQ